MNKGATGKMKVSPLPEDKGDEEAAQEEEDDNPPPTKKSRKSVKSKSKIEKQTEEGMIFVYSHLITTLCMSLNPILQLICKKNTRSKRKMNEVV